MPHPSQKKIHHCVECSKSFNQLASLKRHLILHTGEKPHKCQLCDKAFNDVSNLRRHFNLHHNGKRCFICGVCRKAFKSKANVKEHLLTHSNKKPHKCTVCAKAFTNKSYLCTHMLTHTGERRNMENKSPKSAEQEEKEKLEWVQTFDDLHKQHLEDKKDIRFKMIKKIKENPFVPIGMLATATVLGFGLHAMKTGNKRRSQLMMRTRVLCQGFTVAALALTNSNCDEFISALVSFLIERTDNLCLFIGLFGGLSNSMVPKSPRVYLQKFLFTSSLPEDNNRFNKSGYFLFKI
ncbi:hypothetical protein JTE90_009057 [Oedothorax gibbosus]|uniref:Uncharacterized protein n=1 Tax=Oedothorax gibbosus TaxID=931172 RepID=A0AAV6VKL3_9ARAC|nr:hypothetical protein JTE90_009057 [Oedothorax gibbosus]